MQRYRVITVFEAPDDAQARQMAIRREFGRGAVTRLHNLDRWFSFRLACVLALLITIVFLLFLGVSHAWQIAS